MHKSLRRGAFEQRIFHGRNDISTREGNSMQANLKSKTNYQPLRKYYYHINTKIKDNVVFHSTSRNYGD